MKQNTQSKTIDQLLAEADELVQEINSDTEKEIAEEHRLQFEIHARELEKIKSGVKGKAAEKIKPVTHSAAEGMYEAIQDIVKAMQDWKRNIF